MIPKELPQRMLVSLPARVQEGLFDATQILYPHLVLPQSLQTPMWEQAEFLEGMVTQQTIDYINAHPESKPHSGLIILDGNRRYAKKYHLTPKEGNEAGANRAFKMLMVLRKVQMQDIGAWGLSEDNFTGRDPKTVKDTCDVIGASTERVLPFLKENGGRLIHEGNKDRIPEDLRKILWNAERETKDNDQFRFWVFVDYGKRVPIKQLLRGFKGELEQNHGDVDLTDGKVDDLLASYVHGPRSQKDNVPEFDLMIRTGGERRTSGFGMLVDQSEFVFIDKLLGETTPLDVARGIVDFMHRNRRHGK